MKISYDSNYDVLYLKFIEGSQQVVNQHLSEDITVDRDSQGRITGIEVLAASKHVNLAALLPVELAH